MDRSQNTIHSLLHRLVKLIIEGSVEGKNQRRRPRIEYIQTNNKGPRVCFVFTNEKKNG